MAGLCEGGNDPAGSLKAISHEGPRPISLLLTSRPHASAEVNGHPTRPEIMSRNKSGVKRPPIDPDALKKAVEAVNAPPGNKISTREACSGL
ncbi:hypothetical protein ANN_22220 [Periplaneta americana]|uniref:Uncharacterized protein n=1 Tax=Periplaneta americana TaxID=6978 RepID=A0ABQ8S8H0_PERAM|nr:hypothetical protein ANN_22220 [Periplaneta americana]